MDRSDRTPGADTSLLALYDAVPAAEELDLADEADRDRRRRRVERFYAQLLGKELEEAEPEPEAYDAGEAPTDGQALGILEHLLGARPIEE